MSKCRLELSAPGWLHRGTDPTSLNVSRLSSCAGGKCRRQTSVSLSPCSALGCFVYNQQHMPIFGRELRLPIFIFRSSTIYAPIVGITKGRFGGGAALQKEGSPSLRQCHNHVTAPWTFLSLTAAQNVGRLCSTGIQDLAFGTFEVQLAACAYSVHNLR